MQNRNVGAMGVMVMSSVRAHHNTMIIIGMNNTKTNRVTAISLVAESVNSVIKEIGTSAIKEIESTATGIAAVAIDMSSMPLEVCQVGECE